MNYSNHLIEKARDKSNEDINEAVEENGGEDLDLFDIEDLDLED